jgi:2-polyprenyl-3-methyl-5-hydroxy-6-metoxy-1,4-benzoquinol methylase
VIGDVSQRRVRVVRFIKGIPVLGPLLRQLYYAWLALREGWHTFKANRAFTVRAVTRRNTQRAYEKLFGSDELVEEYVGPERVRFYDEVAEICVAFAGRRVADVGCGAGHLLRALADRTTGVRFAGVDFSENAIRRARSVLPDARWLVGDIYAPPLEEGSFDLVLCTEVLEHLERPREALDALVRLCSPDGRVVITIPDGALDGWEGHVNFWSESDLASFIEPVGQSAIRRIDRGRTLLAVISF